MKNYEKLLIDSLIDASENDKSTQFVLDKITRMILVSPDREYLDIFYSFFETVFNKTEKMIDEIDLSQLNIERNDAIRCLLAKNIYDCVNDDNSLFINYLDNKIQEKNQITEVGIEK